MAQIVEVFIQKARRFYYSVMLMGYACPKCKGMFLEIKKVEDMKKCPKCNKAHFVIDTSKPKIAYDWWRCARLFTIGDSQLLPRDNFLITATSCKKPAIIIILGIIACAAGVAMFSMPLAKLKGFLNWWGKRPDCFLTLLGVLAVFLGVLIIYAAGLPGQS